MILSHILPLNHEVNSAFHSHPTFVSSTLGDEPGTGHNGSQTTP
jgi:hypothetical protein